MGKAIVIKGLQVSNPLAVVTFASADAVLANYLSANATISNEEKVALTTMVGGLIESGLWDKMLYFYPMLGNSVSDMIIDVVDQSTEDIFTGASTDGLSINNRILRTTSKASMLKGITTQRFASLSMRDMCFVTAHTCLGTTSTNYSAGEIFSVMRNSGNKVFLGVGIESGGYRYPQMRVGIDGNDAIVRIPDNNTDAGTQISYKERIILADYNGTTATIYKDKSVYKSGVNYPVTLNSESNFTIRNILSSNEYSYDSNFFAIAKHLTDEEWGTFYDLLLPFLQEVGKHA